MQRDEQPLADLLVGQPLGDQLQHRQFAPAEHLARTARGLGGRLRQQRAHALGAGTGREALQLFAQPFRLLHEQFVERQQGSADCALHGLLQGRQRLALAALLQVQRSQLAEGQASRQQRAVLPRRAGQPVQAPGGFLRASFAALQAGLEQLHMQRQQRTAFRRRGRLPAVGAAQAL